MKKKTEPKWFIRATTIDKANGPTHNMVTTHGTYAHAAQHLMNVIGAERGMHPQAGYKKDKSTFHILPLKTQENPVKKNVRAESLNEFVERVTNTRTRKQIIEDAEMRATQAPAAQPPAPSFGKDIKKVSKVAKPPETGSKTKTITGEKPNKVDMKPSLETGRDMHPSLQPNPKQISSS